MERKAQKNDAGRMKAVTVSSIALRKP